MEFKNVCFELGLRRVDIKCDRDACLDDIAKTVHRLTELKQILGKLTEELVGVTKETKELRKRLKDNYKLVENYDKLVKEYDKAIEILRAADD